jgi:tRNA A37 threonylcarbamoyladenosine modification protein TsaB
MVVVGAGNFTNTRIACVVANTFAYDLQIPLLAIQKIR